MTKARLGLKPKISVFQFMQPHEALFLSLMVTNCLGESFFSRFKRFKNQLKGRNIPGEVVNTKHFKSDKLSQTNCDEFLDNFVMKKAGQNLFNCSLYYVQPYLI